MGKNKKKKASDYKDFISMLKDNKEKIYVDWGVICVNFVEK